MDRTTSAGRRRYLVEWYQPGLSGPELDRTGRRLAESAHAVCADGAAVDLMLTLCLPADEVAFGLFSATSEAALAEVLRHAGLQFDRITEAVTGTLPAT